MKRILISAIIALSMSAAPVFAGQKGGGGGGGHGGGGGSHGGGGNWNNNSNKNYNNSSSRSRSNSYSNSAANIMQNFKFGGGSRGDMLFGVAGIIGALNPPEGQKIIVKGGDVKVQVNFYGAPPQASPPAYSGPMKGDLPLKDDRPMGNRTLHEKCPDGSPYKPNCAAD